MKTLGKCLMMSSVFSLGLSGCASDTSIPEQITALNVGCEREGMKISDELIELNGEHTWIAECGGKKYTCVYLEESGSDCYELSE